MRRPTCWYVVQWSSAAEGFTRTGVCEDSQHWKEFIRVKQWHNRRCEWWRSGFTCSINERLICEHHRKTEGAVLNRGLRRKLNRLRSFRREPFISSWIFLVACHIWYCYLQQIKLLWPLVEKKCQENSSFTFLNLLVACTTSSQIQEITRSFLGCGLTRNILESSLALNVTAPLFSMR